ncbi:TPA: ABC transporter permease [Candidatus Poribacteria bacterium]|nr:ABC transporter permease [Candidatus Poribacteria bacterium]
MRIILILKRILRLFPVTLGVLLIVFSLMHLAPGDPVELMMGEAGHVTEEEIQQLRTQYGLDKPLYVQFLKYIAKASVGDLGVSFVKKQPVTSVIASRLPATVELTLAALILALLIAIPVGIISAVYHYSAVDRLTTTTSLIGVSIPGFYLGIILILIFGMSFQLLPVSGRSTYGAEPKIVTGFYLLDSLLTGNFKALKSTMKHLILPAITLAGATVAITVRMVRSSMLEVIRQDYIRTARAKGLSERKVLLKHALKNALVPTVSVVSLQVGVLLGGNMIIETVFSWPGLGSLAVEAIYARDYPLVQGIVLLYAVTYVFVNLAADIIYTYLNPRVELS